LRCWRKAFGSFIDAESTEMASERWKEGCWVVVAKTPASLLLPLFAFDFGHVDAVVSMASFQIASRTACGLENRRLTADFPGKSHLCSA
jgi:hypothetical protein